MSHCLSPVYTRAPSLRYGRRRRPPSWHGVGSEDHLPLHAKRACVWYWSGKKVAWVDGSDISKLSLSIFFFFSFTLGGPFLMRPGAFWWSALVVISVQKLRPRIVSLWCQKFPPRLRPQLRRRTDAVAHTLTQQNESQREKKFGGKEQEVEKRGTTTRRGKKNKSVAEEESPSSWEVATDGPRKHPNIDTNKTKQKNKNHNTYK